MAYRRGGEGREGTAYAYVMGYWSFFLFFSFPYSYFLFPPFPPPFFRFSFNIRKVVERRERKSAWVHLALTLLGRSGKRTGNGNKHTYIKHGREAGI